MSTPNLDATGHHWVSTLAKYNFWLEYQKGRDNAVADALSRVTTHLPPEAVQAILDGVAIACLGKQKEKDQPSSKMTNFWNRRYVLLPASGSGDACN